jgi:hypothetical protein
MLKKYLVITLLIITTRIANAQFLNKIAPITLKEGEAPDNVSFLLTTSDLNFFSGKTAACSNSIQIIDAAKPWPPRWFALHPRDTSPVLENVQMSVMLNAAIENEKLSYFGIIPIKEVDGSQSGAMAIQTLNKQMQPTGMFYKAGKEIEGLDFKVLPDGNYLIMEPQEKVMDVSGYYHHAEDTAVTVVYENIVIAHAQGKTLFSWNPLDHFGFDAAYLPYRYAEGGIGDNRRIEWSRANAVSLDEDGNILYSYEHIGIGKISRKDGSILWRIDHNKPQINALSDEIPLYLQHDLHAVKGQPGTYTVLSNGDKDHPAAEAFQFNVTYNNEKKPVIKLIQRYKPSVSVPNTGAGGNFDLRADGSYLFNYGIFRQDTALTERSLMEYRDTKTNKIAKYSIAPSVFAYRVHETDWKPARPAVKVKDGALYTDGASRSVKWFILYGEGMKKARQAGTGEGFKPEGSGSYCAVVPYGVGWVVSEPIKITK